MIISVYPGWEHSLSNSLQSYATWPFLLFDYNLVDYLISDLYDNGGINVYRMQENYTKYSDKVRILLSNFGHDKKIVNTAFLFMKGMVFVATEHNYLAILK